MLRGSGCAAVAVLACVSLATLPVRAQDHIDTARDALSRLQYDDALAALVRAERAGKHTPQAMAELYAMMGRVAATLGRDAASEHFRRLLLLDPDARLPEGTSPKIARPFEEARAWVGTRRLAIEYRLRHEPRPTLTVRVVDDPLHMVSRVEVHQIEPAGALRRARGGEVEVALPPAPRHVLRIVAVDRHGNHLAIADGGRTVIASEPVRVEPAPAAAVAPSPATPVDVDRPVLGRWWTWGAVAAAGAGAGVFFGLRARAAADDFARINARSSEHDISEAYAALDRERDSARYANVAFATAGVFALLSAVVAIHGATRADETHRGLTPVIGDDRAGVEAWIRF